MKTLILGDIHGRTIWKDIISKESPDRVIFIGDYFDSFDISGIEQLHNFNEIIRFKEESDKEVILLIGNHDHHYMDVGENYSGYQSVMQWDFNNVLRKNKNHLQIAYQLDDILFTHAGVSPVWMDSVFGWNGWSKNTIVELLNETYLYKPKTFNFSHLCSSDYGDSVEQSPIWIRPYSLIESNKGDNGLRKTFRQVVGHTQVNNIFDSFKKSEIEMDGRYYLIDSMGSYGYAVCENEKLTANQL